MNSNLDFLQLLSDGKTGSRITRIYVDPFKIEFENDFSKSSKSYNCITIFVYLIKTLWIQNFSCTFLASNDASMPSKHWRGESMFALRLPHRDYFRASTWQIYTTREAAQCCHVYKTSVVAVKWANWFIFDYWCMIHLAFRRGDRGKLVPGARWSFSF